MKTLGFAAMLALALGCGGSDTPSQTTPTDPAATDNAAAPQPDGDATPSADGADPLAGLGEAEIARGAKVYEDQCSMCHGDNGEGQGKTPALRGDGAMSRFGSNQELFDYTKAEMPKNDKGSLSDADAKAILAWLKSQG